MDLILSSQESVPVTTTTAPPLAPIENLTPPPPSKTPPPQTTLNESMEVEKCVEEMVTANLTSENNDKENNCPDDGDLPSLKEMVENHKKEEEAEMKITNTNNEIVVNNVATEQPKPKKLSLRERTRMLLAKRGISLPELPASTGNSGNSTENDFIYSYNWELGSKTI